MAGSSTHAVLQQKTSVAVTFVSMVYGIQPGSNMFGVQYVEILTGCWMRARFRNSYEQCEY